MELLNKIQRELKVPKSQFNAFSKYHYRNAEDILEAVKPLLGKGTLVLKDEMVQLGDRFYVKAYAMLNDGENHEVCSYAYAREALDKKGMDEAQITGAASSYARKYALNGLFCIDDTKDADEDDNRGLGSTTMGVPTGGITPKPAMKPNPVAAHQAMVEEKKRKIKAMIDKTVLEPLEQTPEAYGDYVFERTGLELVASNYDAIIKVLQ